MAAAMVALFEVVSVLFWFDHRRKSAYTMPSPNKPQTTIFFLGWSFSFQMIGIGSNSMMKSETMWMDAKEKYKPAIGKHFELGSNLVCTSQPARIGWHWKAKAHRVMMRKTTWKTM